MWKLIESKVAEIAKNTEDILNAVDAEAERMTSEIIKAMGDIGANDVEIRVNDDYFSKGFRVKITKEHYHQMSIDTPTYLDEKPIVGKKIQDNEFIESNMLYSTIDKYGLIENKHYERIKL